MEGHRELGSHAQLTAPCGRLSVLRHPPSLPNTWNISLSLTWFTHDESIKHRLPMCALGGPGSLPVQPFLHHSAYGTPVWVLDPGFTGTLSVEGSEVTGRCCSAPLCLWWSPLPWTSAAEPSCPAQGSSACRGAPWRHSLLWTEFPASSTCGKTQPDQVLSCSVFQDSRNVPVSRQAGMV